MSVKGYSTEPCTENFCLSCIVNVVGVSVYLFVPLYHHVKDILRSNSPSHNGSLLSIGIKICIVYALEKTCMLMICL